MALVIPVSASNFGRYQHTGIDQSAPFGDARPREARGIGLDARTIPISGDRVGGGGRAGGLSGRRRRAWRAKSRIAKEWSVPHWVSSDARGVNSALPASYYWQRASRGRGRRGRVNCLDWVTLTAAAERHRGCERDSCSRSLKVSVREPIPRTGHALRVERDGG